MTDITLKAEQHSAMEAIYNHQDVIVWVPTGYGKSLCYQVLPFIMDYMYKHGVVEMQRQFGAGSESFSNLIDCAHT